MATDVIALTRFSTFLAQALPEVDTLAGLDRAVLERYLAWLATSGLGHGAREDAVTGVGMFFQAVRQHDWDPSLAATAAFFTGDLPHRPARVSRRLAEHVMAWLEEQPVVKTGTPDQTPDATKTPQRLASDSQSGHYVLASQKRV